MLKERKKKKEGGNYFVLFVLAKMLGTVFAHSEINSFTKGLPCPRTKNLRSEVR